MLPRVLFWNTHTPGRRDPTEPSALQGQSWVRSFLSTGDLEQPCGWWEHRRGQRALASNPVMECQPPTVWSLSLCSPISLHPRCPPPPLPKPPLLYPVLQPCEVNVSWCCLPRLPRVRPCAIPLVPQPASSGPGPGPGTPDTADTTSD